MVAGDRKRRVLWGRAGHLNQQPPRPKSMIGPLDPPGGYPAEWSGYMARARRIGILTAGGDSPGLNAAIRGIGKAAIDHYDMVVVGFRDGFRGLVEDRSVRLERQLSGILTVGGTILGTSRDKPHRMLVEGEVADMTGAAISTYEKHRLDALVCLG